LPPLWPPPLPPPPPPAFRRVRHCRRRCQIDGPTPLCLYLLRAHKVALVTGEGFGCFNGVRLSYATSMEDLAIALDQLEGCLRSLR
jgi:aspartate/methionine/tyrosine aminotransferase